jgi:hypothetical protein
LGANYKQRCVDLCRTNAACKGYSTYGTNKACVIWGLTLDKAVAQTADINCAWDWCCYLKKV